MYACLDGHNFVHIGPLVMFFICKCSSLNSLHSGIVVMHVTSHLEALIIVAKVHVAVKC